MATRPNGTINSSAVAPSVNLTPGRVMAAPSTPIAPPANGALAPPPEGIFRSFDDLLTSVQRIAKDNGYGIVKLRASNYRDAKPTRYDLVCDRGGVKYSSTAKKRNPSTRKVDCPFRAKAVCEVSLSNQWRFVVQDARHNHEARAATATPGGQEGSPMTHGLRNIVNRIDRISHDVNQGFQEVNARFDRVEKRLDAIEQRVHSMGTLAAAMPPNLGSGLNNGMSNAPAVIDSRLNNVEARLNAIETRGLDMPLDDVDSRMLSSTVL